MSQFKIFGQIERLLTTIHQLSLRLIVHQIDRLANGDIWNIQVDL